MKVNYGATFLKGLLMGICDAIPGISGGTIAFITGIYERLINAIKGFSPSLFYGLFLLFIGKGDKKRTREEIIKLDLGFLATLVLGILVALLLLSRIMSFLLGSYFAYTMIFFFGLILASAKTIFDHIEKHHTSNVSFMFLGLLLGVSLLFVIPASLTPGLFYVTIGGFVAISAMVLPGISGAFILLVLGIYGFMLDVVRGLPDKVEYLAAFAIGALIGLFTISRVVSWLFKKDKSKTLYFLLGLVLGGLSVPIRSFASEVTFDTVNLVLYLVLFLLGILFALLIRRLSKK